MNPIYKIENFNGGMVDSVGEGKNPANTFADSWNLVPTKTGSLESVHGYSTTGGLAAFPTAFPVPTAGTSTTDVASIKSEVYPFSSELPIAYDGRVYFVADNQGSPANHVMLDTWFKNSTSKVTTPNDGFVFLDERKEFLGTTTTVGANTLTVTSASATHGLSTTDDYYNDPPWIVEYWASGISGAMTGMALVTNYSYAAGTAVITTKETINGGGLNWAIGGSTAFRLRRWFHHGRFNPDFGTRPGQCFTSGGRTRGCGGPSADATYVPWVSQYIDRTFFTGNADAILYKGTYVDQMECVEITNPLYLNPQPPGVVGGFTVLDAGTYRVLYTLEYDGYEEGSLFSSDNYKWVSTGTEVGTFSLDIPFATLNKRVTAINLYVAQELSDIVSEPYFIRRYDLVTPSTVQATDATYGWNWIDTTGIFKIDATSGTESNANYQVRFTGDDWAGRGETYYSRTGRVEEYVLYQGVYGAPEGKSLARHYVVWQYTENVNGRQFFSDFYDPNTLTYEKDTLRFTGFDSNGNPNLDVIPYDKLFMETDVASGDPSSIKGLIGQSSWLYVFKDSSVYSINISPFPEAWVRYTVSRNDGLYSTRALALLPEGEGIIFGDSDHLKMIHNQKVTVLTHTIAKTYYDLTYKSLARVWYDKIDRAICLADGPHVTFYRGYFDLAYRLPDNKIAIPWYHCISAYNTEFISVERDGSVIFTNSTATAVYKWHKTDYTNAGASLATWIQTNKILPDPTIEVVLSHVMFWRPVMGTSGTLIARVDLDGTTVNTWTGDDITKEYLFLHLPMTVTRQGKKFLFNAFGELNTSGKIQVGGIYFYGTPVKSIEQSA